MSEIREGISSEVSSQIISFPLFPYLPISPPGEVKFTVALKKHEAGGRRLRRR
ncbi:MAG: hypothetical protein F6J92_37470 [Symploca sp. SIO1A3]|nr:hypothetical protein [Symploca sp. SIO1A3]